MRIGTFNSFSWMSSNAGTIGQNQLAVQKTAERLSTGLRINRAADDAAGLGTAEKREGAIRSMSQGIRNLNDGVNLVQTAEGAIDEQANIIKRAKELAVQASSEVLSNDERAFLNVELDQILSELDRISAETAFGSVQLLNRPAAGGGGAADTPTFSTGPFIAHADQAGQLVEDTVIQETVTVTYNGTDWDVVGATSGNIGTAQTGAAFISKGNNVGSGKGLGFTIASGTYDTGANIDITVANGGTNDFGTVSNYSHNGMRGGVNRLADFDGDGDLDVLGHYRATSNSNSAWNLVLSKNNGDGTFATATGLPNKLWMYSTFDVGDIDGDNDVDVVGIASNNVMRVFTNDGAGNFTASTQAVASNGMTVGGSTFAEVEFADVDNDNDLDIITVHGVRTSILKNDGSGTFTTTSSINDAWTKAGLTVADFNSDGFLDYAAIETAGTKKPVIMMNDGTGSFTASVSASATTYGGTNIEAADFDQDGDVDLISTRTQEEELSVFDNDGSNAATGSAIFDTAKTVYRPGEFDNVNAPMGIADLNDDGVIDVATASTTTRDFRVSYTSGGVIEDSVEYLVGGGAQFLEGIATGDLNGDGSIDILGSYTNGTNFEVFLNNRTQTPTAGIGSASGGGGGDPITSAISLVFSDQTDDTLTVDMTNTTRSELGLNSVNVLTAANAQASLATFDAALSTLSKSQSDLGAFQNRLTHAIHNLEDRQMSAMRSQAHTTLADLPTETTRWAKRADAV